MIFTLLFLILVVKATVEDIKSQRVSNLLLILMGGFGFFAGLTSGHLFLAPMQALIFFLTTMFLHWSRHVKLGMADVVVISVMPLYMPLKAISFIIILVETYVLGGLIILLIKRKNITLTIPVMPYILISLILTMLI